MFNNVLAILWIIVSFMLVYACDVIDDALFRAMTSVFIMFGIVIIVMMDIMGVQL